MKAIGGLFDRICTHENLAAAAWRAAQGKRRRPAVIAWLAEAGGHLARMAEQLLESNYCFSPYRSFPIRDPKSRTIHAPAFGDRVLHHAIVAVCGPVLESGAMHHSYACRAGKGQHAALEQVCRWLQPDHWFLKIDIAKYYDSVPHAALLARLGCRFRETRLLRLWQSLLGSYSTGPALGLPIGALTSQYLGNFYLDPVDVALKAVAPRLRLCRYMDDFLLLGTREELQAARTEAMRVLAAAGLAMKHGGVLNRVALGVPFLGFTLYPDRVRLNAPGRRRLRQRCRSLARTMRQEHREPTATECSSLRSQFAHAAFGDDLAWRQHLCARLETLWERQGPATRHPRRFMDEHGGELPLRVSQQEPPRQPQQESGIPALLVLRHGGTVLPPDDAFSSAPLHHSGDEHPTQSPPAADICLRTGAEKDAGGGLGRPSPHQTSNIKNPKSSIPQHP